MSAFVQNNGEPTPGKSSWSTSRNNGVEESLEDDINWNYWWGKRVATYGRTKSSFSLQTWQMKQQWSKFKKSWKAWGACSLILVSGNCLCWRNMSVLYPSKCRLSVCYSDSQAAVCGYQWFTSKPGSVRTESQPSKKNIKTVEAKTVLWFCVNIFLCFTLLPQPPSLFTLSNGFFFSYFYCLPVDSDYLAGLCTLFTPWLTGMDVLLISCLSYL